MKYHALTILSIACTTALVTADESGPWQPSDFGYPLEQLHFAQDAEDEPEPSGERPFYGGPEGLLLTFSEISKDAETLQSMAGNVVGSHPTGEWQAEPVKPSIGMWRIDASWAVPGQPVVILQCDSGDQGEMVFFHTDKFRKLLAIKYTSNTGQTTDWGYGTTPVAIEPERLYFKNGVPAELKDYFPEHAKLYKTVPWWQDYAHPEEKDSIENWRLHLEQALAEVPAEGNDKHDKVAVQLAREVLAAKLSALPEATEITGAWKIRSMQGGPLGTFAYPWFKGGIVVTDRPQELAFGKDTGSQRRGGKLLPALSRHHLVFLGGKKTDYTGKNIYSTLDGSFDSPREASDSGGVFFFLEPGRAVMVMDVTPDSWEIYEMERIGDEGML